MMAETERSWCIRSSFMTKGELTRKKTWRRRHRSSTTTATNPRKFEQLFPTSKLTRVKCWEKPQ